jgi:hypothetical protein
MNFVGTILALTQITLTEHITVDGRVLARNADVTFIHDVVNKPTCSSTPGAGPPPPVTPPPPAKNPPPPRARKVPRPRPPVHRFGLTG